MFDKLLGTGDTAKCPQENSKPLLQGILVKKGYIIAGERVKISNQVSKMK